MVHIARSETWRASLHQKATNSLVSTRPDDCKICNTAVGDPHLRAIQYERTSITSSCGAHTTCVTSGIGFSEAKTSYPLTSSHTWQPAPLLLLRTRRPDRKHS